VGEIIKESSKRATFGGGGAVRLVRRAIAEVTVAAGRGSSFVCEEGKGSLVPCLLERMVSETRQISRTPATVLHTVLDLRALVRAVKGGHAPNDAEPEPYTRTGSKQGDGEARQEEGTGGGGQDRGGEEVQSLFVVATHPKS
jgi:uncharacterized membrane protein YgcG